MRRYALSENGKEPAANLTLLLHISDVYSSNVTSAELFVDPWQLLGSNHLSLESDWLATGTLIDGGSEPASKQRLLRSRPVSRLTPGSCSTRQRRSTSDSLQAQQFAYRNLQSGEMRLVNILPGSLGDPLHGVVIHVRAASTPPYRALSYVWGTDQQPEELSMPDGTLSVTASLSKALRSLRRKDQMITLWVDAICINQKDGREKEKQIRMLPVIFQNASLTYAFLGGGDGVDSAVEMLMQVRVKAALEERSHLRKTHDSREDERHGTDLEDESSSTDEMVREDTESSEESEDLEEEDWPIDLPKVPASWRDFPMPHLEDEVWACVHALFSLPFFRRVWIVQEVVAAFNVKIVCGKWTIDWSDLHLAMEIVERHIQLYDSDTTHTSSSWEPFMSLAAQREWEVRSHRWSLSMLLEHFRYTESTLKRDRLFAMLGLASDGNEPEFEPDYESPLETIVLRFARVFVRQGRGMQLLYRAGLHGDNHRFPSWIPDWTIQRPASLADVSEGGITFGASGPHHPIIKCVPESDELLVDGYTVDLIESVSTSSNVEEELAIYFSEIDAMVDGAELSPSRTSLDELKWKVPIAGALFPKVATSGGVDLKSSYKALRSWLGRKGKGMSTEVTVVSIGGYSGRQGEYGVLLEHIATETDRTQSLSYLAALRDTVQGWRFAVTKNGFVGTVPDLAQAGDVVAILKGGRVPFILQKSDARSGAFRLIGECYVHGLMNGEGLSLPDVEETTFSIH